MEKGNRITLKGSHWKILSYDLARGSVKIQMHETNLQGDGIDEGAIITTDMFLPASFPFFGIGRPPYNWFVHPENLPTSDPNFFTWHNKTQNIVTLNRTGIRYRLFLDEWYEITGRFRLEALENKSEMLECKGPKMSLRQASIIMDDLKQASAPYFKSHIIEGIIEYLSTARLDVHGEVIEGSVQVHQRLDPKFIGPRVEKAKMRALVHVTFAGSRVEGVFNLEHIEIVSKSKSELKAPQRAATSKKKHT